MSLTFYRRIGQVSTRDSACLSQDDKNTTLNTITYNTFHVYDAKKLRLLFEGPFFPEELLSVCSRKLDTAVSTLSEVHVCRRGAVVETLKFSSRVYSMCYTNDYLCVLFGDYVLFYDNEKREKRIEIGLEAGETMKILSLPFYSGRVLVYNGKSYEVVDAELGTVASPQPLSDGSKKKKETEDDKEEVQTPVASHTKDVVAFCSKSQVLIKNIEENRLIVTLNFDATVKSVCFDTKNKFLFVSLGNSVLTCELNSMRIVSSKAVNATVILCTAEVIAVDSSSLVLLEESNGRLTEKIKREALSNSLKSSFYVNPTTIVSNSSSGSVYISEIRKDARLRTIQGRGKIELLHGANDLLVCAYENEKAICVLSGKKRDSGEQRHTALLDSKPTALYVLEEGGAFVSGTAAGNLSMHSVTPTSIRTRKLSELKESVLSVSYFNGTVAALLKNKIVFLEIATNSITELAIDEEVTLAAAFGSLILFATQKRVYVVELSAKTIGRVIDVEDVRSVSCSNGRAALLSDRLYIYDLNSGRIVFETQFTASEIVLQPEGLFILVDGCSLYLMPQLTTSDSLGSVQALTFCGNRLYGYSNRKKEEGQTDSGVSVYRLESSLDNIVANGSIEERVRRLYELGPSFLEYELETGREKHTETVLNLVNECLNAKKGVDCCVYVLETILKFADCSFYTKIEELIERCAQLQTMKEKAYTLGALLEHACRE